MPDNVTVDPAAAAPPATLGRPPPLCAACESNWRSYAAQLNRGGPDAASAEALLVANALVSRPNGTGSSGGAAALTHTLPLEARKGWNDGMVHVDDNTCGTDGDPVTSNSSAANAAGRDDAGDEAESVDDYETRNRILSLQEALQRQASRGDDADVLATPAASEFRRVDELVTAWTRSSAASASSTVTAAARRSSSASPNRHGAKSPNLQRGRSSAGSRPHQMVSRSAAAGTYSTGAIDVIIASSLATQRAALERRERKIEDQKSQLAKEVRELNRGRTSLAFQRAQLENAFIEFQKREAELAKAEEELIRQRRMLKHHRDNEILVRAASVRRIDVSTPSANPDGAFEMRDSGERGGTPTASGRSGLVHTPVHASPSAPRVQEPAAIQRDVAEEALAVFAATEQLIDDQRAALRRDAAAQAERHRAAAAALKAREARLAQAEDAVRAVADDLRLVMNRVRLAGQPMTSRTGAERHASDSTSRASSSGGTDTTLTNLSRQLNEAESLLDMPRGDIAEEERVTPNLDQTRRRDENVAFDDHDLERLLSSAVAARRHPANGDEEERFDDL